MNIEQTPPFPADGGLPPLPGEICAQFIRCGKANCRCELGRRHGPYYYRVWREGAHVHKVYVRRTDLDSVRQACEAYRRYQQTLRDSRLRREDLSRNIQSEWRATKRLLRAA